MSRRRTSAGAGSGHFRAALNDLLLVATLAAQSGACADAEATRDGQASGESATAASAVVPARDARPRCVDAGVVSEGEGAGGARHVRSACPVELTRRGDPLTIEYQIK